MQQLFFPHLINSIFTLCLALALLHPLWRKMFGFLSAKCFIFSPASIDTVGRHNWKILGWWENVLIQSICYQTIWILKVWRQKYLITTFWSGSIAWVEHCQAYLCCSALLFALVLLCLSLSPLPVFSGQSLRGRHIGSRITMVTRDLRPGWKLVGTRAFIFFLKFSPFLSFFLSSSFLSQCFW